LGIFFSSSSCGSYIYNFAIAVFCNHICFIKLFLFHKPCLFYFIYSTTKKEVVKCLRDHDRRPLDCYREVESFKEEVRRLEGAWVEKIIG